MQFSPIYKFYNIISYASSVSKNLYQFSHFSIATAILKFSELKASRKSDSVKGTLHKSIAFNAISQYSRLIHTRIMSFSYSAPGHYMASSASFILFSSSRMSIINAIETVVALESDFKQQNHRLAAYSPTQALYKNFVSPSFAANFN